MLMVSQKDFFLQNNDKALQKPQMMHDLLYQDHVVLELVSRVVVVLKNDKKMSISDYFLCL
jgi:hypothetical protein